MSLPSTSLSESGLSHSIQLTIPPLANLSIFALPFLPAPTDGVSTATSREQLDTEAAIHRVLSTSASSAPDLRKAEHGQYIGSLFFGLPAPFTALDASRPWLLFWSLHSFDLMGVALDQGNKDRYVWAGRMQMIDTVQCNLHHTALPAPRWRFWRRSRTARASSSHLRERHDPRNGRFTERLGQDRSTEMLRLLHAL
jgi:hypothetical protein